MSQLAVTACQINPVVGALDANITRIVGAARGAADTGAQVAVFGEMALTGYPVEDLLLRRSFATDSQGAVHRLAGALDAAGLGELIVVIGYLDRDAHGARNSAAVLHRGEHLARYDKHFLPNYGVFDELRWFTPGDRLTVLDVDGVRLGLLICEDAWRPGGPAAGYRDLGVDGLLCLNASPFQIGRPAERRAVIAERVAEAGAPILYVNLVGGQDELVFDGDSFFTPAGKADGANGGGPADGAIGAGPADGAIGAGPAAGAIGAGPAAPQFTEAHLPVVFTATERPHRRAERRWEVIDVQLPARPAPAAPSAPAPLVQSAQSAPAPSAPAPSTPALGVTAQVWAALVTGTRDYVHKVGGRTVALGLSGGIDSALVAAIAVDAVGAENVYCVSMPSKYSSDHSRDDARELAARTGLHYRTEPIGEMVRVFVDQLHLTGLAEENIQARCRGMTLMAISNAEGQLVLATGNKSELAVGYSTIYGDAVGAYAPIRDVPKSLVWELSRWRNTAAIERGETPPIPESSITKEPSAELRPDQRDSDSLPDYDILDEILRRYVELDQGVAQISEAGFDPELIRRIARLVDRAEYKRRQYPPGPKVTGKAFGRDRRMPISNRWHDPA